MTVVINIFYGFYVCMKRTEGRSEQFIREIYFSHIGRRLSGADKQWNAVELN
jgi:hypothetical protein